MFGVLNINCTTLDGYQGKTLSFLIKNFYAQVLIQEEESSTVKIVPNPNHDANEFTSLHDLFAKTSIDGYYGGVRLIRATCKTFYELCNAADLSHRLTRRGFTITYETNIPRQVDVHT